MTHVLLKSDGVGKTSAKLSGRSANLVLPPVPLALTIRAQLIGEEKGLCLESTFSAAGVKENATGLFKGTSD